MKIEQLAADMINAASVEAKSRWDGIKNVAIQEFEVLAQRLVSIRTALAQGMTQKTARLLFQNARSQIVAVLAMLSTMVVVAAEKIVKAALNVVKKAVNTAVGFALVV